MQDFRKYVYRCDEFAFADFISFYLNYFIFIRYSNGSGVAGVGAVRDQSSNTLV